MAYKRKSPIPVIEGGTGDVTLPLNGVLLGDGTGGIAATGVGTNGQVLIGATSANPEFASLTSSGSTLTYTLGVNTLNIDVTSPLNVTHGGTGNSSLTVHGVLVGESTSAINATVAGTTGQVLIGSTGADPAFGALGVNSSLTSNGVLLGNNLSAITATAAGTTGQVLTGVTSGAPTWQSPAASSITITGDSGGGLTGNSFTFTGGTTGLTFAGTGTTEKLTGTLDVANGGTGAATLTGVLIGNGTSAVTGNAITQYDTLVGGASNAITSVAPSATAGVPLVSGGSAANPSYTTAVVAGGGTGATTLTSHGVLLGNGTSAITATTAGTTGQVLTGVTGSAPTFQSPASSSITIAGDSGGGLTGNSFTFTGGTTGLTFSGSGTTETLIGTLDVANGGTGATTLTGVLIGNGTSAVTGNAITQHDVLIGGSSNAITSVAPSATSGVPLISQGSSTNPAFGTAVVAGGGTGATTLTGILIGNGTSAVTGNSVTQYDVLVGGASNAVSSVGPGTALQVLQSGGAAANPAYSTATYPATTTMNQLLYSSSANVVGGVTAGDYGVLISSSSGVPSWLANGTTGQVLTATTSGTPSWEAAAVSGIVTLDGNTGSATGSTVTVTTGASNAQGTSTFTGSGSTVTLSYTDANSNVGIGTSALSHPPTGSGNVAIGVDALEVLTSGSNNTAVGESAGVALTTTSQNTFIGNLSGPNAGSTAEVIIGYGAGNSTSGSYNIMMGYLSGYQASSGSGSYNIGIGYEAATSYTSSEASNILLNSPGVGAESHVLRIGSGTGTGNQNLNKAFISGITGINAGSIASVATIATTNQLGSATITAGTGITVTPTANTITIASSVTPVTTINGNSGSATGSTITITTGASSAQGTSLFTASGSTVTHTFMSGTNNIGLGTSSLASVTGGDNTAFGGGALQANTSASANTALGYQAGNGLTTGGNNTMIGYQSMSNTSSGTTNCAFGFQTLQNCTGNGNLGIGYTAGSGITSGGTNVALGNAAGSASSIGSNNIYISNAGAAESNTIRVGGGSHTSNFQAGVSGVTVTGTAVLVASTGQLGIAVSSRRFKNDIKDMGTDSNSLYKLRPVSFMWDKDSAPGLKDATDKRQYGLIAEEAVDHVPFAVNMDSEGKPLNISYENLIGMLINEVQRLSKRIEVLENK
jgi:hypothetical protein